MLSNKTIQSFLLPLFLRHKITRVPNVTSYPPPPPVKAFFSRVNFAQFVRKDLGTTKHLRLASLAMAEFGVTSTKVAYKWPLRWFVNMLLTSWRMSGDPIREISHQFTLVASLEATRTERRVGIHVQNSKFMLYVICQGEEYRN